MILKPVRLSIWDKSYKRLLTEETRVEEYPDEEYAGQLIVRIGKDGSFEYSGSRG